MPHRAKPQAPAPDAFKGFTPSKPFDGNPPTSAASPKTNFAGPRVAADPAQEMQYAAGRTQPAVPVAQPVFEEETEEEEETNIADCLGVQEEHWKEAILFPVPNEDPTLDCSLRADMSRYEKDLRLIRFVEILGMVNISIK